MKIIATLTLLAICFASLGQNLVNQDTIYIGPSNTLYVAGNIVNNNLIINNGDMQVGGAWTNNAQYDAGTGKITFNSDLPQVINHNAQSFSRLSVTGGGIKNFLADITIINELDLQDGLLISQNDSRIVFEQGASILGGSDQSHIHGSVYQQGSGSKLFPVGNGTTYLPVELSGIGSTSEVGITLVDFSTPQLFAFNAELSAASASRYWEIDLVSGSLAESQISLPIHGDEGFSTTDVSRFVVTQSAGSPIEFESLGVSSTTGTSANGRIVSGEAVTANLVSIGVLSEGISVYNAISANPAIDNLNSTLKITNIGLFPNNKVTIFNRWGDRVFEIKGYDNNQNVFMGNSNVGGNTELPSGTYFYLIDKGDGSPVVNGFLSLKR